MLCGLSSLHGFDIASGRLYDLPAPQPSFPTRRLSALREMLSGVVSSSVTMKSLSIDDIEAYWATGEPCDKAGAYAIQGIGARFVRHLEGSYSAVMGLPLYEVSKGLEMLGFNTWAPFERNE